MALQVLIVGQVTCPKSQISARERSGVDDDQIVTQFSGDDLQGFIAYLSPHFPDFFVLLQRFYVNGVNTAAGDNVVELVETN